MTQSFSGVIKALVITAALFIVFAGIKTATNILVPFLLSTFIAIICNPLVVKAEQYKVPKPLAVVFVIALFVGVFKFELGLLARATVCR